MTKKFKKKKGGVNAAKSRCGQQIWVCINHIYSSAGLVSPGFMLSLFLCDEYFLVLSTCSVSLSPVTHPCACPIKLLGQLSPLISSVPNAYLYLYTFIHFTQQLFIDKCSLDFIFSLFFKFSFLYLFVCGWGCCHHVSLLALFMNVSLFYQVFINGFSLPQNLTTLQIQPHYLI